MSSKVTASFSAFGDDLPSIALIVLYILEGSVLSCGPVSPRTVSMCFSDVCLLFW